MTGEDGRFTLREAASGTDTLSVTASGFAPLQVPVAPGSAAVTAALRPGRLAEQVTVTASRTALPVDASASDTRVVSQRELREAPGFALDDGLRQVPGFELYRRTSSWIANPTTQGVSLRGLGSTAASRTLVLSDEVPLNDPFGGWVHWDEIPQLAVSEVEVLRGGASDLYGSSAIGGVINVIPVRPNTMRVVADGGHGGLDTSFGDGLLTGTHDAWGLLAAGSVLRTGGYILTAPAFRGTVDTPYNVHDQSGRLAVRRSFGDRVNPTGDVFVRGNVLNEARDNGTPLETNATRLWRYAGGADRVLPHAGRVFLRLYGSDQGYRQSYSAIAADRDSEQLTDLQRIPSQELGLAAQWAQTFWRQLTFVGGVDVHDVRADDREQSVHQSALGGTGSITARQRDTGPYAEALWEHGAWSAALSGRVDRFRSFDVLRSLPGAPAASLPSVGETVFDSRLGVVRRLGGSVALSASVFRAFRGPTLNELYRNGQVGQISMLGNPLLRSERATGTEAGMLAHLRGFGSVRAGYFWTEVNRPITFIDLSRTASAIVEQRQNLGQIRSRGVSLDLEAHPYPWLAMSGGYQFAKATVTRFAQDPGLVGEWLPEVARNTGTAQLRASQSRLGTLNLIARVSGRDYDDVENTLLLHGYFRLDSYYERPLGAGFAVYGSAQNIFDRAIDAGRTPVLTLATPRVLTVGLRFRWGRGR